MNKDTKINLIIWIASFVYVIMFGSGYIDKLFPNINQFFEGFLLIISFLITGIGLVIIGQYLTGERK